MDERMLQMVYDPSAEIGGWYLLDPEHEGIERIVDEECVDNPVVVINDKDEALEHLEAILEEWNVKDESETSGNMVKLVSPVPQFQNVDNGPNKLFNQIVEKLTTNLQGMFAIEHQHEVSHTEPVKSAANLLHVGPASTSVPEPSLKSVDPVASISAAVNPSQPLPNISHQQAVNKVVASDPPRAQSISFKPTRSRSSKVNPSVKVTLPKLSGFITKQGSFFHTWKRRYFVLDNRTLSYYNDPQDLEKEMKSLGQPFTIHNKVDARTVVSQNGLVSVNIVGWIYNNTD
jgi:hypothetical protein